MMRMMTKRTMREETMSKPMRMKVTIKMATKGIPTVWAGEGTEMVTPSNWNSQSNV
jgi:hypothetical protein